MFDFSMISLKYYVDIIHIIDSTMKLLCLYIAIITLFFDIIMMLL